MMPYCSVKRCRKVADKKLGVIDTGEKYLENREDTWTETVYVCEKHYIKLLKKLGFTPPKSALQQELERTALKEGLKG